MSLGNIKDISFKKPISPNLRLMVLPLASIVLLVVIFLFSLDKAYKHVNRSFADLRNIETINKLLDEKVTLLEQIQPDLLEKANDSVLALPWDNPSLVMFNQIKKISESIGLPISDIKISPVVVPESNLFGLAMDLSLMGSMDQFFTFYKGIAEISPISFIQEVSITETQSKSQTMRVGVMIYWSYFPQRIPNINEPINTLTKDEGNQLLEISKLKKVDFSLIEKSLNNERESPFN